MLKEVYHKEQIRTGARDCGFELCGFAAAEPSPDLPLYREWVDSGYAGEMRYLTDHRAGVRADPRQLLASVRTVICLGRVYNWPAPYSTSLDDSAKAWISRYAWGDDYHDTMRADMSRLVESLAAPDAEFRICVDTAPLLERSYARLAGLGWIGRNTCLINQQLGSWVFLGEILTSLEIQADSPPPDRCGTCRRCIDACPTQAIVPAEPGRYTVDSRLCISYFTIELRGPVAESRREGIGNHVFGCDICQDVCPWNRRAATTPDPHFAPRQVAPDLAALAALTETEFRDMFRGTPVTRARYSGFLRNVAMAIGNSDNCALLPVLQRLSGSPDTLVSEAAAWAQSRLTKLVQK